MKKFLFLFGLLLTCTASAEKIPMDVGTYSSGGWDFIAPTITSKGSLSNLPVGLIIYDTNDNRFYAKDSLTASSWQPISSGTSASVASVHIKDVQSQGTGGGTATAGSWLTRNLNTLENPLSVGWVSLASNQITLQAGTYEIQASVPGNQIGQHQTRLRNVTDGTDTIIGTPEYSVASGSGDQTRSFIMGTFTISAAKTFEIQHYCQNNVASVGLGDPYNITSEVYTIVKITKVQ